MHERKARMAELADGVIVLPGGFGTWEEAFEILTWNQLGILNSPLVFVDIGRFFQPLFQLIERAVGDGFVSRPNADLAQLASSPAEAVRLASITPPPWSPKWVDRPSTRPERDT